MSSPPTSDARVTYPPKSEPIKAFPDYGTIISKMAEARAAGDEALYQNYRRRYEIAKVHGEGWMAHAPMLASVIATARPGPVLEIGIGRGSTPLILEMCKAMGRPYAGLDKESAWVYEMGDALSCPGIEQMDDWVKLPDWLSKNYKRWAVVFVDNDPLGRLPAIVAVRDMCEFVVVHDTWNLWEELRPMHEYLDTFKFRSDYTLFPSCTSVVSDVRAYSGAT
jgi:hypothetical protein